MATLQITIRFLSCLSAYKDLVRRKEIRENLWNTPGWDDTVANTGSYKCLYIIWLIRLLQVVCK